MSETDSKILERLEEWEQKEGQLPSFIQLYRELLQIQSEAKSRIIVTKPSFTEDLISDRLREGVSLLSFEDFSPDWHQVQTVLEQVAVWATKDSEDSSENVKSLQGISRKSSLLKKATEVWYRGNSLTSIKAVEGIDEELLTSVLGAALKPFLFIYSRLILPEVNQELWRRKYCPICGGKPDFAYLDKEIGTRWLICSRCDAEWLFLRLECPYCSNKNQDTLAYFTDDEGLYRLYICDQCHTYIKAVDLRHTKSQVLFPLERMITLDMDREGQEKGYKPGWTKQCPSQVDTRNSDE